MRRDRISRSRFRACIPRKRCSRCWKRSAAKALPTPDRRNLRLCKTYYRLDALSLRASWRILFAPMKRTRHLIAVALVATALCADRAVASAPEIRSEGSVAGRIVSRITTGLRRVVSPVRIYETRQDTTLARPLAVSQISDVVRVDFHPTFSQFQFRLPPPTL